MICLVASLMPEKLCGGLGFNSDLIDSSALWMTPSCFKRRSQKEKRKRKRKGAGRLVGDEMQGGKGDSSIWTVLIMHVNRTQIS
jgi:hypothetical protein